MRQHRLVSLPCSSRLTHMHVLQQWCMDLFSSLSFPLLPPHRPLILQCGRGRPQAGWDGCNENGRPLNRSMHPLCKHRSLHLRSLRPLPVRCACCSRFLNSRSCTLLNGQQMLPGEHRIACFRFELSNEMGSMCPCTLCLRASSLRVACTALEVADDGNCNVIGTTTDLLLHMRQGPYLPHVPPVPHAAILICLAEVFGSGVSQPGLQK